MSTDALQAYKNDSLWDFLKSIEHALERCLSKSPVTSLDKDRLAALVTFLKGFGEVDTAPHGELAPEHFLFSDDIPERYAAAPDIREKLQALDVFREGSKKKLSQKKFEARIRNLKRSVEKYLQDSRTGYLHPPVPKKEFDDLLIALRGLLDAPDIVSRY